MKLTCPAIRLLHSTASIVSPQEFAPEEPEVTGNLTRFITLLTQRNELLVVAHTRCFRVLRSAHSREQHASEQSYIDSPLAGEERRRRKNQHSPARLSGNLANLTRQPSSQFDLEKRQRHPSLFRNSFSLGFNPVKWPPSKPSATEPVTPLDGHVLCTRQIWASPQNVSWRSKTIIVSSKLLIHCKMVSGSL